MSSIVETENMKRHKTPAVSCSNNSDYVTPWTVACQDPLSMGFSRQEYWSGLAIPFSRESSWPRDRTRVSCIGGRFFTVWTTAAAAAAKSGQSCPTLCDPIDGSPPGSSVPGILQARTLEWVAISSSSAWKWKVKVKSLSRAQLLATPRTAAYQAPPSMGFPRQEYWSGVPLPSPVWATRETQKESDLFLIKSMVY